MGGVAWAGSGSLGTPSCCRARQSTLLAQPCRSWRWAPSMEAGRPMALPCALGLGLLLALPGALGSGSTKDSRSSSSVTIVLLLLLLLLLVIVLALAWHRLSRDSGGYYHPVRLGAALWGRTRRLLWASPPGRWLRERVGSPDNNPEKPDAQEDYTMPGSPEEAEPPEEGQWRGEGLGPERAGEAHDSDSDGDGGLGLSTRGPAGSGGSAEALLSDLHAFAGSAAWDDSARAAGGQGLHVTAL